MMAVQPNMLSQPQISVKQELPSIQSLVDASSLNLPAKPQQQPQPLSSNIRPEGASENLEPPAASYKSPEPSAYEQLENMAPDFSKLSAEMPFSDAQTELQQQNALNINANIIVPAICTGAKFDNYADFERAFEEWKMANFHPFRVASSETLKQPDGSTNDTFKYRYIVFHCAHYGAPRMRGAGKRPNQNYLPCGCRAMLRLNYSWTENALRITTLNVDHQGHEVNAENFVRFSAKLRRSSPMSPSLSGGSPSAQQQQMSPGMENYSPRERKGRVSRKRGAARQGHNALHQLTAAGDANSNNNNSNCENVAPQQQQSGPTPARQFGSPLNYHQQQQRLGGQQQQQQPISDQKPLNLGSATANPQSGLQPPSALSPFIGSLLARSPMFANMQANAFLAQNPQLMAAAMASQNAPQSLLSAPAAKVTMQQFSPQIIQNNLPQKPPAHQNSLPSPIESTSDEPQVSPIDLSNHSGISTHSGSNSLKIGGFSPPLMKSAEKCEEIDKVLRDVKEQFVASAENSPASYELKMQQLKLLLTAWQRNLFN